MEQQQRFGTMARVHVAIALAGAAALIVASACNSNQPSKTPPERGSAASARTAVSAQDAANPGINLDCVYDRLRNPPESFHYVYKKTASDGFNVEQEADVSPQTIDGFRAQPDGSHQPIHGVRSDPQSWQKALAGITGISGMAGTVSTFNNTSAMQRESGGGQVNGYQTIHYSIDTARWDTTTRQMLGGFTLGPGGFDKGDAWVMADGCPVKLVLDDEMHKKDGSLLGRTHYEEEMVKK